MSQSSALYQPLDKGKPEIRLLEVVPATTGDAPMEVKMVTRDLKQAVSDGFIPLSYVWGDERYTKTIIVNGIDKEVRMNLATFLRYIRETVIPVRPWQEFYKGKVLFWADAICVNQSDVDERSHQVSLMNAIYSSSKVVVCWLGVSQDAHLAFELFKTIHQEWFRKGVQAMGSDVPYHDCDPNYGNWMSRCPDFWRTELENGIGNEYWNAAKRLLESEYWSRVWILQEIALPQRPLMLSGSTVVPFSYALTTCWWVLSLRHRNPLRPLMMNEYLFTRLISGLWLKFYNIPRIFALDQSKFVDVNQNLTLISKYTDFQASDPRDKIFALLGRTKMNSTASYRDTTEDAYSTWITELRNL